ncbi:MAG: hypothetical protein HS107_12735 [Thermoflexaceae bacterium]|nr:hypothetical protein [Thermoflexaceae bacterium]
MEGEVLLRLAGGIGALPAPPLGRGTVERRFLELAVRFEVTQDAAHHRGGEGEPLAQEEHRQLQLPQRGNRSRNAFTASTWAVVQVG